MPPSEDEWLKMYLQGLDKKIDALSNDIHAHMSHSQREHQAVRSDLNNFKARVMKWVILTVVGAGGASAGIGKAIAALIGN